LGASRGARSLGFSLAPEILESGIHLGRFSPFQKLWNFQKS